MKVCCKIIVTAIEPAVSLMATNVFQIMIVYSSHMPSFLILLSLMCYSYRRLHVNVQLFHLTTRGSCPSFFLSHRGAR